MSEGGSSVRGQGGRDHAPQFAQDLAARVDALVPGGGIETAIDGEGAIGGGFLAPASLHRPPYAPGGGLHAQARGPWPHANQVLGADASAVLLGHVSELDPPADLHPLVRAEHVLTHAPRLSLAGVVLVPDRILADAAVDVAPPTRLKSGDGDNHPGNLVRALGVGADGLGDRGVSLEPFGAGLHSDVRLVARVVPGLAALRLVGVCAGRWRVFGHRDERIRAHARGGR